LYWAAIVGIVLAGIVVASAGALGMNRDVTLPEGEVGQPYPDFEFEGEEGCQPYHWHLILGNLPPGMTVEEDGTLTGTPTAAGDFQFWVQVTDGIPNGYCHSPQPSEGQWTVRIAPQVLITSTLPGGAKVGAPFSSTFTAAGGGTLEWSVVNGALPPGLTLNRVNGALTGTPSTVGSYNFGVKVADSKRQDTKQYTFVVGAPLAVKPTAFPGEVGSPFTATIPVSGGIGPLAWGTSAGASLPAGLSIDGSKGTIRGTPTASGKFSFPLTVADSDGQTVDTKLAFSIEPRLKIATTRTPPAKIGKHYRLQLKTRGGVAPRGWTIAGGKLPAGLELSRSTGLLAGTPRAAGRYTITVRAADKLGVRDTQVVVLNVAAT
jgi:hypothetical protein